MYIEIQRKKLGNMPISFYFNERNDFVAGRPKGAKNISKKDKIKKTLDDNKKMACFGCNDLKFKKEFYVSYNPVHINGKLPYCMSCIKKMICDESGNVTLDRVKDVLQKNDLPFIYNLWQSALREKGDTFGIYKKNLALNLKDFTWKDSVFLPEADNKPNLWKCKIKLLSLLK